MNTENAVCETNQCETEVASNSQQEVRYVRVAPRVRVVENANEFRVIAEMPGVDENGTEITLEKNVLKLVGRTELNQPEGYELAYGYFRQRQFERAFTVPEGIDREGLGATIKNGILTVTLPKAKELQPTRVAVKAG